VLAKVSRDIFSKILNHIFVFWPAFLKEKASFLWKIKMSRHTRVREFRASVCQSASFANSKTGGHMGRERALK